MRHLSIQNMVHRMHMPGIHPLHVADHLLHDEHFWKIVHMLAFLAVLLMFAFWTSMNAY